MKGGRIDAGSEEDCPLLDCCAASSSNSFPTFGDNLSVPFPLLLKNGPIGCLQVSVRGYHYSLRNSPENRNFQILHGRNLKPRNC